MKRNSKRGRVRQKRSPDGISQLPFQRVQNPLQPVEVLNAGDIEKIHHASMRVLEEVGMRVDCERSRALLLERGNKVDDSTGLVQFDRGFVEEMAALAPASFRLHTRNPDRYLDYGGNNIVFAATGGEPFLNNLETGRQPGTMEAYDNGLRLIQSINVCHFANNGLISCLDQPHELRHLDTMFSILTLMDKGIGASVLGRTRAEDSMAMAAIVHGMEVSELNGKPVLLGTINTNSPLVLDAEMAQGAWAFAEHGQIVSVTPFTLSGAMSPATIPGALVQQNAEALATIALLQAINPGTPCIYGTFTSNVDMKTGSPGFGTPEYVKATLASCQLGRHYGLPIRASNTNASNVVDAQAAYESQMSLWACVLGHANHINHGLGWMEGGLSASFEKCILDVEMIQMLIESFKPLEINDSTLGVEAIKEVGPGGHFFGAADTLARYETDFYSPMLSDWSNFENWTDNGSKTATERTSTIWKKLLAEYEEPEIDSAVRNELTDFVNRRKREIGHRKAS